MGFTLVEVMMAAVILLVGFIGMIEAVVIGAGMMDNARRQTLAAQVLSHEAEQLRLLSWTAINALPDASTLGAAYSAGTAYYVGDTVTYNGSWYRCIQAGTGQTPSGSSSYWRVDTPPYANSLSTSGGALGATFTLTRTTADVVTGSLREATFTIEWKVKTSRRNSSEELLTFTYRRTLPAYYGKYGLNLSYQRS
jgi:Tfp pilus assembly protein PilV